MNEILAWLSRLLGSWKPWVVVPPWEVVIRVRLGRRAAALGPGPHSRIPFVDQLTWVNTRLRIETAPTVTKTNGSAGRSRVIRATVAFRIADPLRAVMAYTHPGPAVVARVQAETSRLVPAEEALACARADLGPNGIEVAWLYYTEDVEVRTYRLLQGQSEAYSGPIAPQDARGGDLL